MAQESAWAGQAARQPEGDHGRIVRTASQARQGEIILGRRGRWVWFGAFVLMMVLAAVLLAY